MTSRPKPLAESRVGLADIDEGSRRFDLFLGVINRLVLGALVAFSAILLIFVFAPSGFTNALSPHDGPVLIQQRAAFLAASIVTGLAAFLLRHRLMRTWAWARLPSQGMMVATRAGLRIKHPGVLYGEVRIEWQNIKAITLDSGSRHDTKTAWRRFPVPSPRGRVYLFATDGPTRPQFSLIAARPVAPNIVIILKRPVALSNPNAPLVQVAFPDPEHGVIPAFPPGEATHSTGLFLRVADLRQARDVLLPSHKLRALRAGDVAFGTRNDRWSQSEVAVDVRESKTESRNEPVDA